MIYDMIVNPGQESPSETQYQGQDPGYKSQDSRQGSPPKHNVKTKTRKPT
jgi:hypothetical protein